MKTSLYKDAILAAFQSKHTLSIADIQKAVPRADFSTIFRNVESLAKSGVLKKIAINADQTVYELYDKNHEHDHFVCVDCGTVEEIHIKHKDIKGPVQSKTLDIVVRGVCGPCCS